MKLKAVCSEQIAPLPSFPSVRRPVVPRSFGAAAAANSSPISRQLLLPRSHASFKESARGVGGWMDELDGMALN